MKRTALFRMLLAGALFLVLCLEAASGGANESAATQQARSAEEIRKQGERMYRDGVLPSGAPMMAYVSGDVPVDGTAFTCVSCHLRAGIGSIEGGVYTPPTNGTALYQPLKRIHKGVEVKYDGSPFLRPAYTDETLAEMLRGGVDPAGKVLNEAMPRYLLEDKEMAILISYLKTLSAEFSPGITDTTIRFATVISEDADPEESKAMVDALEKFMHDKNMLAKNYQRKTTQRDRLMAKAMSVSRELEPRKLILARWIVKGPPATWRTQLEEYNRTEPAFALLGGIVTGEWEPIHRFCEDNKIPSIFPNTDFPVVSGTDWYTLYLSKGYYQEGEAVARYLNSMRDSLKGKSVVQIVRSSREGKALAAGFEEAWKSFGHDLPTTVRLDEGGAADIAVQQALATYRPETVILWDGAGGTFPVVRAMASSAARPERVFVSSGYLGRQMWDLPEPSRDFVYLAYPYRLPQDKVISPMMGNVVNFKVADDRISKQTYSLVQLLSMAVMKIKGNYYRDNLLDVIGMTMDLVVPLYERISFGPGQRYASKGCYIVQMAKGDRPELAKRSDWVIH